MHDWLIDWLYIRASSAWFTGPFLATADVTADDAFDLVLEATSTAANDLGDARPLV